MDLIRLLRIKHYIKNGLILLPLIFSRELFRSWDLFGLVMLSVIAFSLITSAIYIFNDIRDREKDAKHPVKCQRPIASGRVSVPQAVMVLVLTACLGGTGVAYLAWRVSPQVLVVPVVYVVLNVLYSMKLKEVPILEIAILSSGFLLRVIYGGAVAQIHVSDWLYLTILSASFYLGLGKRRNELKFYEGQETRKVLEFYNVRFLDRNMYMFLALSVAFYSLWSISQETSFMWTVPLVMISAMRYSLVVEGSSEGDPVELLLKDKVLICLGVSYAALMFAILYL